MSLRFRIARERLVLASLLAIAVAACSLNGLTTNHDAGSATSDGSVAPLDGGVPLADATFSDAPGSDAIATPLKDSAIDALVPPVDSSVDAGPCTDIENDVHNCGACGHDCLGAACNFGVCTPQQLWINTADPGEMTLFNGRVYWSATTPGILSYVSIDGGFVMTGANLPQAWGLTSDDASIYLGGMNSLDRLPAGANATRIAVECLPRSILSDEANLYFISTCAEVRRIAKDGTQDASTFLANEGPNIPLLGAIHDTRVFFTLRNSNEDGGSVVQIDKDGGFSTPIISGEPNPVGIAVDDTSIYWANQGLSLADGAIRKMALGGPPSVTLAIGQSHPSGIAIDDTYVYWVNGGTGPTYTDGQVLRVAKDPMKDTTVVVLATNQAFPSRVAVDDHYAYWITQGPNDGDGGKISATDGTVMRVAK